MLYPEFQRFKDIIASLTPTQLSDRAYLQEKLRTFQNEKFDITYTPFDYINPKAKIAIVGITLGYTQLHNALTEANRCLKLGLSDEETLKSVKLNGAFSSPPGEKNRMRELLVKMLDAVYVSEWLGIKSCLELFEDRNYLVQTCSLIKNATFTVKKDGSLKNYSGGKNDILKKDVWKLVEQSFIPMTERLPP